MDTDENKQPQLIGLSGTYKDNEYLLNKEEFRKYFSILVSPTKLYGRGRKLIQDITK